MGSGALSWKTKRQPRVSSSICQGEYTAAELCLQEVNFIRDLLADVGFPQPRTPMFIDNQATIKLMLTNSSMKKHDRITLHVLQEAVNYEKIIPIYIPSAQNIADMFTKANAAKNKEHDKKLMSRITGNDSSATKCRDHIIKIIKENYTDDKKISDVRDADQLLKLVY